MSAPSPLIGTTVGNYRIEELLGTGGMGQVFRGVHVHLGRPAAVKIMHPNLASDETFQARFLQEARGAAALTHPNIVQIYDFGQQDNQYYLVMELVAEGSLRTLLDQHSTADPLDLATALDLVRQAAEGLGFAHRLGMVHRDIKPENLLLRDQPASEESEGGQVVKVADFGLARLADTANLTLSGTVMGTPAYMSPEQCQGHKVDPSSDIYSLGVVLYELVTGARPFEVKTPTDAIYKHVFVEPPPPRGLRGTLPEPVEALILRCLAKQPANRFANGSDLARALRLALDTLTAPSGGATIVEMSSQPVFATPPPAAVTRRVTVRWAQEELTTPAGTPANASVVVENTGDAADTFHLTVAGIPAEWVWLPAAEPRLEPGQAATVPIRLAIPATGSQPGSYTLMATARSTSETGVSDSAPLRCDVLSPAPPAPPAMPARASRVEVRPDRQAVVIRANRRASLRVVLANTGTAADTFAVTVSGVPAEWVELPPGDVMLEPGKEVNAPVRISAPVDGTGVGEYQVTIVARSTTSPGISASADIRCTVEPPAPASTPALAEQPFHAQPTPPAMGLFTPAVAPVVDGSRGALSIAAATQHSPTQASYMLTLANRGAETGSYTLRVTPSDSVVRFQLPPGPFVVAPGASVMVPLAITAPKRLLGSSRMQTVTVSAASGDDVTETVQASVTQPGGLPLWLPVVAVLLVLGGVLAAATIFRGGDGGVRIVDVQLDPPDPAPGESFFVVWDVDGAAEIAIDPLVDGLDPEDGEFEIQGGVDAGTVLTFMAIGEGGDSKETRELVVGEADPAATSTSAPVAEATATSEPAAQATATAPAATATATLASPQSTAQPQVTPPIRATAPPRIIAPPPTEAIPATEAPLPGNVPVEGDTIFVTNMTDWAVFDENGVAGFADADSYHLRIKERDPSADYGEAGAKTYQGDFGDYSFSVNLRLVEGVADIYACITFRTDPSFDVKEFYYGYSFCLSGADGQTKAYYYGTAGVADAQPQSTDLLAWGSREGVHPANEWNTLKVIVRGNEFFFFVNDSYAGTVTHEGERVGSVGVQIYGYDPNPSEWQFTNMVMRALQ
jgi:hypothetical protein